MTDTNSDRTAANPESIAPELAEALDHHQAGRLREAESCYRTLLDRQPDHVDALHLCGVVQRQLGRPDMAAPLLQRALALKPDFAEAHYNLGNALRDLDRLDAALAAYRAAVTLLPAMSRAHNAIGNILFTRDQVGQAADAYRTALEFDPGSATSHYSLGIALQHLGRLSDALPCFHRALELDPDHPEALLQLVHVQQHLCDWSGGDTRLGKALRHVHAGRKLSPFLVMALKSDAGSQLAAARNWAAQRFAGFAELRRHLGLADRQPGSGSRIAVGYLSGDLQQHATGHLITELFELHDRQDFQITAYSFGTDDGGALRTRIVQACDRFVDIRDMPFAEAARRIDQDGIDILVDLKGYTFGARTEIMALRPAPIQVNWLGYPGTMGADFIDYIIVDDFIAPDDLRSGFDEKRVLLPDCYQVNDRKRSIDPLTPRRTECGLPEHGLVFGCFNNAYKITPDIFDIWMRLLNTVPGSVLWLLKANRTAAANLRREAEVRGVAAERLVFAPFAPTHRHLARYRLVDLALDTFPVNGHTTTSDALWAGCPVVTLAGQTLVSRVAGSLLRAVGLPELITTSPAGYAALALRLAQDRHARAELRGRLERNRLTAPLFDSPRFTRNLEAGYKAMIRAAGP